MFTYDEYLEMACPEHPLDQMDLKDIAAHLHACSLEDFFKCKYEFQPLGVAVDEILRDLYQGFAGIDILRLLIEKAMEIDPEDARREVEEAMAKFNNRGEKV